MHLQQKGRFLHKSAAVVELIMTASPELWKLNELPDDVLCNIMSFTNDEEYFRRRCAVELNVYSLENTSDTWRSTYALYWQDFYNPVDSSMRCAWYGRDADSQDRHWELLADGLFQIETMKRISSPVVGAVVDTIVIPVKSVSGGRVLFSQELQYDTVFKWREPAGFQWTSSDGHREYAVMFRGHMAATDALRIIRKWQDGAQFWIGANGGAAFTSTVLEDPNRFLAVLIAHSKDPKCEISTVELSFLLEIMGPQQIGTRLSLLFSDFCVIQDWFGPMSSLQPRLRRFFRNIGTVLDCGWFHGFTSRRTAEALLEAEADGSFLLRCSTQRMNFAVSFRHKGKIRHSLIVQEGPHRYRFLVEDEDKTLENTLQAVVSRVSFSLTRPRVRKNKRWTQPMSLPMYAQIPTVEPEYKCKMPLFELGEVEKIRARFSDFWKVRPEVVVGAPAQDFEDLGDIAERRRGRILADEWGFVYRHRCAGMHVAVRVLSDQSLVSHSGTSAFQAEAARVSRLPSHESVLALLGTCLVFPQISLVHEDFAGFITLEQFLYTEEGSPHLLTWHQRVSILTDVACGLAHMHAHGITHRDVRPNTILVHPVTLRAKLWEAGFGWVKFAACDSALNMFRYQPPELFPTDPRELVQDLAYTRSVLYGSAVDVYSFGLVMTELFELQPPFAVLSDRTLLTEQSRRRAVPALPTGVSDDLRALAARCVCEDPEARPSMSTVIELLRAARP